MDTALFDAILSMDSYDRGYNSRLTGLSDAAGTQIGDATILANSSVLTGTDGQRLDQPAGFYAIAYQYTSGDNEGQITIAYRGTDPNTLSGFADDVLHGWPIAAGVLSSQALLAFQFYQA